MTLIRRIIKETKEITINEILRLYENEELSNYIVFYYSQNTDYPVFLQPWKHNQFGFVSPVFDRRFVYTGNTLREALEAAQKGRDLFIILKNDFSAIFKKRLS